MSQATESGLPRLFTPAEVARALQQSENYVVTKARRREWPHCRMARGAIRFTAQDVEAIVALTHQEPAAATTSLTRRSAAYWARRK